jgi:hypothetical protein
MELRFQDPAFHNMELTRRFCHAGCQFPGLIGLGDDCGIRATGVENVTFAKLVRTAETTWPVLAEDERVN